MAHNILYLVCITNELIIKIAHINFNYTLRETSTINFIADFYDTIIWLYVQKTVFKLCYNCKRACIIPMQKVCILSRQILICDMQIVHPVLTGNLLASSKRAQEAGISLSDLIKKIHVKYRLFFSENQ